MPTNLPILRVVRSMRPLPAVAQQVLTLVQDPDYAIDELVDLVRTEPTLVARILRLCNSARSGLDQEITAIGDAVTYVGSRNLVQLTLVSCSASTFAATGNARYTDADSLWRHSLACALACQELAQQTGLVPPAVAFTAGILHDVGRVALSQLPEAALEPPAGELPHERVERAVFGQDHAAVAALVGDVWQLPGAVVTALRTHHDPEALGEPLPALLHVADQLALQQGFVVPFGHATAPIEPAALARLGISTSTLEALAARAAAEMERTAELLNLGARPCR